MASTQLDAPDSTAAVATAVVTARGWSCCGGIPVAGKEGPFTDGFITVDPVGCAEAAGRAGPTMVLLVVITPTPAAAGAPEAVGSALVRARFVSPVG